MTHEVDKWISIQKVNVGSSFKLLQLYDSTSSLLLIGGDNCITNTGKNLNLHFSFKMLSNFLFLIGNEGGVCYLVETFLGRNLSRAFCLIHFIELPFKILMKHYLGDTTGPSARDGMLGEDISELPSNAREMVDFETISGNLEEVDKELIDNYDQYYAYHLAMGIQKGAEYLRQIFKGTPPLPSKLYHARFLLTALHIMRLYIQSNDPSDDLKRAVTICVKWYIPLFFWIKKKCHINSH